MKYQGPVPPGELGDGALDDVPAADEHEDGEDVFGAAPGVALGSEEGRGVFRLGDMGAWVDGRGGSREDGAEQRRDWS